MLLIFSSASAYPPAVYCKTSENENLWNSKLTHFLIWIWKSVPLILRGEHRLRVFGCKVLRKLSWLQGNEVTLQNLEFHNFSSSPRTVGITRSRRMEWATYVARMRETRNAYRILVDKLSVRDDGRRKRRCGDNTKMEFNPRITDIGTKYVHVRSSQ
jgi:hypothetical protein